MRSFARVEVDMTPEQEARWAADQDLPGAGEGQVRAKDMTGSVRAAILAAARDRLGVYGTVTIK